VGKATGIDAVFGSMLNPTGGLVGMDNESLDFDSCALGYHGIAHDAGGYLLTYRGIGPGYDYLGRERGLGADPANCLIGHREGIYFWRSTVGHDPISDAALGIADKVSPEYQKLQAARETAERVGQISLEQGRVGQAVTVAAAGYAAEKAVASVKANVELARGAGRVAGDVLQGSAQVGSTAVRTAADVAQSLPLAIGQALVHGPAAAAPQAAHIVAELVHGAGDAGRALAETAHQIASDTGHSAAQAQAHLDRGDANARAHVLHGATQAAEHVGNAAAASVGLLKDGAMAAVQAQRSALRRTLGDWIP
jgi:hypothetical protein